jgi:hypothetical protein
MPDSSSFSTPSLSSSPSEPALPQPTILPDEKTLETSPPGFDLIGIVINNNQTNYKIHFRGTKQEICENIDYIQIPITVFWRFADSKPYSVGSVSEIYLVDPFTGLELEDAVQTYHPLNPSRTYSYNINTLQVFDYLDYRFSQIDPLEHHTWLYTNGDQSKSDPQSIFADTYSATKILRFKSNVYGCYERRDQDNQGIAYNVAEGILPSIEFSLCPVLNTRYGEFNQCHYGLDYSTASFSYIPERIPD